MKMLLNYRQYQRYQTLVMIPREIYFLYLPCYVIPGPQKYDKCIECRIECDKTITIGKQTTSTIGRELYSYQ